MQSHVDQRSKPCLQKQNQVMKVTVMIRKILMAALAVLAFHTASAQPKGGYIAGEKASQERIRVATKGLANPERGFRFEILVGVEDAPETESKWPFPDYRDDGIVMTQAYCYLNRYWDCDIPQSKIDALQSSFDRARRDGVKFVLRFAYEGLDGTDNCPSLERILSHIEQLTPIVRKNIDVIYTLQTGWVGLWGEFHSNPRGLDRDPEAVAAVLDATLKMLPESRSTMMRCMRYRTTAETAAGPGVLDMGRVGFFNDGTLAGTTDGGTFLDGSTEEDSEFDQLDRESQDMPIEGELFWNSVPNTISANAINAIHRFIRHHYTTFSVVHSNSELDFTPIYGTIDAWKATPFTADLLKAQGLPCDENYFKRNPMPSAYEYFRDHFGYRLEMVRSEGALRDGRYEGEITLRNVGFARPINPRKAYLVLFDRKGHVLEYPLDIDARSFMPWEEVSIHLSATLPEDARKSGYKAALWLPDESDSIRYRPEYAMTIAEGTTPVILGGRLLNVF